MPIKIQSSTELDQTSSNPSNETKSSTPVTAWNFGIEDTPDIPSDSPELSMKVLPMEQEEEIASIVETDFNLETPTISPKVTIDDIHISDSPSEEEEEEEEWEDEESEESEEEEEEALEENEEDESEDEEEVFYDLLVSFFRLNPSPTDEQVHSLAAALGVDHEDLEAMIYEILSIMMEDQDLSEEARELVTQNLSKFQV